MTVDLLTFALLVTCVQHEASFAGIGKFRTFLTGVSPSSTNGGAAEILRASHTSELALTLFVFDLREARTGALV